MDQIGATCTDRGHASLLTQVLLAARTLEANQSLPCERSCCHHGDESSEFPNDDKQPPPSPYHLCSSTHAVFIAPVNVELPDLAASSQAWLLFDWSTNFIQQLMPPRGIVSATGWLDPTSAPPRAQLQVFQI
jgi:hypothetical protein